MTEKLEKEKQRDARMIVRQTEKIPGSNCGRLEDGWNDKPKVREEKKRGESQKKKKKQQCDGNPLNVPENCM